MLGLCLLDGQDGERSITITTTFDGQGGEQSITITTMFDGQDGERSITNKITYKKDRNKNTEIHFFYTEKWYETLYCFFFLFLLFPEDDFSKKTSCIQQCKRE